MSSRVFRRRRSGTFVLRSLITRHTSALCQCPTSTRAALSAILSSRLGSSEKVPTFAQTQSGRTTDTTPLSSVIPTDTITLTSPIRSTRTSSEVPWAKPIRTSRPTSLSTDLANLRLPETGLSKTVIKLLLMLVLLLLLLKLLPLKMRTSTEYFTFSFWKSRVSLLFKCLIYFKFIVISSLLKSLYNLYYIYAT
jgi:hypothetical protein